MPSSAELKIQELQQRLTAADERADVLEGLLREVVALDPRGELLGWQLDGRIDEVLQRAEVVGDERPTDDRGIHLQRMGYRSEH